jgi:alpha-mannosidase
VSFFRDLERVRGIPMYEGDLHYHAVGCYSVMRNIKKAYRSAEHAFACAERASEMAIGTGGLPPAMSEQIAFNAFHDILPGSCVRHAAKQAIEELGCVSHQCREHVYRSLKRLSLESPARFPEGEFRIFNTLPFPVTAPLALESMTYFRPLREFRENNRSIPIQEVLPLSRAFTHRWEFVDTLPPQGFRSYHFEQDEPVAASIRDIPHFAPGSFAALPFLARPIRFLLLADKSDLWGHGVKSFNEVDDEFQLVAEGVMDGPVVRKTHQRWTCRRSVLDITYSSYRELPGIYAHIEVSWAEERAILKMEMEPAEAGEVLVMQAPGGPVERPADGLELPLHRWVALGGLSVIQDGAFACDAAAGRLRLTLVRSSIYSLHDPVVPNPLDPELLTDQGAHSFRLLFLPQASAPAQLDSIAAAFLEPCIVIREACRELS